MVRGDSLGGETHQRAPGITRVVRAPRGSENTREGALQAKARPWWLRYFSVCAPDSQWAAALLAALLYVTLICSLSALSSTMVPSIFRSKSSIDWFPVVKMGQCFCGGRVWWRLLYYGYNASIWWLNSWTFLWQFILGIWKTCFVIISVL